MLLRFRRPLLHTRTFMARAVHAEARMAAAGIVLPPPGAPKVAIRTSFKKLYTLPHSSLTT